MIGIYISQNSGENCDKLSYTKDFALIIMGYGTTSLTFNFGIQTKVL